MRSFTEDFAKQCRAEFPGLQRQEAGEPAIFFDGPAGTQVPRRVADAMSDYLLHHNANHGGYFSTSRETDSLVEAAGDAFADFVNADDRTEVVFGQNMTSLTFALSRSLANTWQEGDEIVLTALDHDANHEPWALAAREKGVRVHLVPFDPEDCTLNLDELGRVLSPRTRLVAVGCACNASGGLNPVKKITELAHDVGAEVFLDAVHYGPHGLIDVKEWGCDYLGFSAYKFFGPHLGAMWARRERWEALEPYKVRPSSNDLPWRWMTGTQSFESIVGGQAAIDYLRDLGRDLSGDESLARREALVAAFRGIREYEADLAWKLVSGLQAIEGIRIYGLTDPRRRLERFPTVSFTHPSIPTPELARELANRGVYVWAGNYYALEFTKQLGLEPEGMIRVGLVHYNLPNEIERFLEALSSIIELAMAGIRE